MQKSLGLVLPNTKPLLYFRTAQDTLDKTEDELLDLILDGKILYAFDIATTGARARELRIHRASLEAFKHGTIDRLPGEFAVIQEILPAGDPITAARLKSRLRCSTSHIANLIQDGLLVALTPSGFGPSGSAPITRASAIQFLTARRVA